jgi:hypothetical protein
VRADAAAADRSHAVRAAAREWAGLDAATLARVDALYPDDRSRSSPGFRALLFVFALLAGGAATGLAGVVFESAWVAVVMGALLLAATEIQVGAWRRAGGGAEAATAFLGVILLAGGTALVLADASHPREIVLARVGFGLAAIACCLGARRWGLSFLGVGGALALLALLATAPGGRVLWVIAAIVGALPLLRATTARRFPPAHRRSFAGALVVLLGAGYLALNLWSLDGGWIEEIGEQPPSPDGALRVLAAVATAALPLLTLAAGVMRRRRLLLWTGAAMAVASAVTLRHYVRIGPLWLLLTGAGLVLVAATLVIRRALAAAPEGERRGFSAAETGAGQRIERAAATAVAVAVLTPETRPAEAKPDLTPGGGTFGGGGASDSF